MSSAGDRHASRRLGIVVAAILVVWAALTLPLAFGERTLYFRDVFHSHLPWKAFGAEQLRDASVPAWNPTWAMGQAFRGNPNTVALYPGNALYVLLPFWPAFNLHYALHWLLAGIAMFALARGLRLSAPAAVLAGLSYGGSGFMLAALTFYNVLTVVAWWPLAILGAVRGGARGAAIGALACGMALYGGEPMTALVGCVPLLALGMSELGPRRGALSALVVAVGGALVALPQLVATWRIVGFSFRGSHGVLASQASYYSFDPRRLLELLVPFPFGHPGWFGPTGLEAWGMLDHLPYFFSMHLGLVAVAIGALAWRRSALLGAIAASGFVLAWLLGLSGEVLVRLAGGLFRTPEKLLFWPALVLPLLAARGVERVRSGLGPGVTRAFAVAAVAAAAAAGMVALFHATPAPLLGAPDPSPEVSAAQREVWLTALAIAAALLGGMALAVRLRSVETLLALELAALLQLAPLWMTDDVAPYRRPPPAELASAGEQVVNARMAYPPWSIEAAAPAFPPGPHAPNERLQAAELAPAPGVLHGLSYPLAPDLDGLHHLFTTFLTIEIRDASWHARARWLEVLGANVLVTPEPAETPAVVLHTIQRSYGARSLFYRVLEPAPSAWWPDAIEHASSPLDAFQRVARSPAGSLPGVVPEPIEHRPGGRVRVLAMEADQIELEVESDGGLVVVQRAFQPLFRARAGDQNLPTLPVNLALLGIVVPAGEHSIEVTVSSLPETIAAIVAVVVALAALAVLVRGRGPARLLSRGTESKRAG